MVASHNRQSEQDWDTAPPANVDDIDISDATAGPVTPKPSTVFTQTSLQIILLQALSARVEVIQYSNSIRGEPSYDDALRVGAELSKACRENKTYISKVNQTLELEARVTQLNINLLDLSIRHFLLLLHRPFAARGMKDPHFYFSRKVCLEAAVTILNYPPSESPTANQMLDDMAWDDYAQLKVVSGGFFKGIIIYAVMIIFQELQTQLEEDGPTFMLETKASREALKQCLRGVVDLVVDRIAAGENNVLGHMLISVFLAQIDAMEEGINPEPVVLEAAKKSTLLCYELLSARITGNDDLLHTDTGSTGALQDFGDQQDFDMELTMQNWSMDQDMQRSWLQSDCEDGVWWHS